jgi:hypothetical protein
MLIKIKFIFSFLIGAMMCQVALATPPQYQIKFEVNSDRAQSFLCAEIGKVSQAFKKKGLSSAVRCPANNDFQVVLDHAKGRTICESDYIGFIRLKAPTDNNTKNLMIKKLKKIGIELMNSDANDMLFSILDCH